MSKSAVATIIHASNLQRLHNYNRPSYIWSAVDRLWSQTCTWCCEVSPDCPRPWSSCSCDRISAHPCLFGVCWSLYCPRTPAKQRIQTHTVTEREMYFSYKICGLPSARFMAGQHGACTLDLTYQRPYITNYKSFGLWLADRLINIFRLFRN